MPLTTGFARFTSAVVTVVLGAAALTSCSGSSDSGAAGIVYGQQNQGPYLGTNLKTPYQKPDVTLTDTNGDDFNFATDTKSPVTLVFFGYTNCPDICFAELSDVALALRKVDADVRAKSQLVFITTDPARDTPPVIRAYLDRFGFPSYVGLTGSIDTISAAGYALGVAIATGRKLPDGGYEVAHGTQVIGFGPDGTAPVFWNDTPHDDMATDITLLASTT